MDVNPTKTKKNSFSDENEEQAPSNGIDYRGVTRNETRAYFRNKKEQKRMDTEINSYKLDAKHKCMLIKTLERRISASMNSIDLSTGHTSFTDNGEASNPFVSNSGSFQSARSDYLTKRKSVISLFSSSSLNTDRTEISTLNNIEENNTNSATTMRTDRLKSASWQQPKREISDETTNEILSRVEDADERAKMLIGRMNRSKSFVDGIVPQNRIRTRSAVSAITFNPNPIEWRYYRTQKKLHENIDITNVDIEDKKLLSIYLKKCEVRNSIPKIPKNLVSTLKQRDPIYAKRYRQVNEARICSRAPRFDESDNDLNNTQFPKVDAWRLKKRVLNQATNQTLVDKPQVYKMEMIRANEKVKQFLDEVTHLC